MTPESWQQVDKIFQAAIELGPEERAAFLDSSCGGDEELRREVESLISSDLEGLSLIDAPAFETAVGLFASEHLQAGQRLGHYQIVSLLGAGGMGEVYLAEDTELGRKIAIKVLPVEFTKNKERLRRFRQEARAASALNHPNILTIHQISQIEDRHFMATEFVEGETLRQRLKRAPIALSETLEIAGQVASALSAAHKAGIVHRDIKPENIMLRPDGYVKVLDFGLAKLTEQHERVPDVQAEDRIDISSGLVMGTVKYMSPEQALGLPVDARSDIFSFGVVLYEMLAGHSPFEGKKSNDLIAAIVKKEPSPLTDLPEEIQRILSKALRKKKEERYETIEDLLLDLKILKEDRTVVNVQSQTGASKLDGLKTSEATTVSTASTIEYVVSGIRQHKTGTVLVVASLAIVVLGATFGLNRRGTRPSTTSRQMRIERIPGTEKAAGVAVSPNGQDIAYTSDGGLWVRQLASSSALQIVPPAKVVYPTYSPNGEDIFYVSNETLYRIPARGGEAISVITGVNGRGSISFAPDGKQFTFVRVEDDDKSLLMVANVDGTGERVLTSHKQPGSLYSPAWSPDGSLIACTFGQTNLKRGQNGLTVLGVRVATGEEAQITSYKWQAFDRLAWLPDGGGLVASAMETGAAPKQIWHIPYPAGEPRKITNDLETYVDVSLSADGNSLVTLQSGRLSNLWVAPGGDTNRTRSVPFGERKLAGFVSWTPDGRILCPLDNSGERDLWIVNADGTNPKQLTANAGRHLWPQASPDGRYIVFSSNRASSGNFNIWRMNIDGSNPIQLTDGDGEVHPTVSPDGLWVVYSKGGIDTSIQEKTLWKVPIDGGASVQLTSTPSSGAAVSADGNLIACWYKRDKTSTWRIALIPFNGGPPARTYDVDRASIYPLRWTPDGQAISYVDMGEAGSNIWSQPISGGPPKQVTQLPSERILGFDWSRDGQLVYLRIHNSQDVVLITDFR
jgi:serine/threonine protein kinase/Tol biopolymer transport system component